MVFIKYQNKSIHNIKGEFMSKIVEFLLQEAFKKLAGGVISEIEERVAKRDILERNQREALNPKLKEERLIREAEEARQQAIRKRIQEEELRQEKEETARYNSGCLGVIILCCLSVWLLSQSQVWFEDFNPIIANILHLAVSISPFSVIPIYIIGTEYAEANRDNLKMKKNQYKRYRRGYTHPNLLQQCLIFSLPLIGSIMLTIGIQHFNPYRATLLGNTIIGISSYGILLLYTFVLHRMGLTVLGKSKIILLGILGSMFIMYIGNIWFDLSQSHTGWEEIMIFGMGSFMILSWVGLYFVYKKENHR